MNDTLLPQFLSFGYISCLVLFRVFILILFYVSSHIVQCCYPERSSKKLSSKLGHTVQATPREGRHMKSLSHDEEGARLIATMLFASFLAFDIQSRQLKSKRRFHSGNRIRP